MLAGSCLQCLRGVAFLECFEEVLAMFWRGVAFWRRCLQLFWRGVALLLGGAWHFGGGACSV